MSESCERAGGVRKNIKQPAIVNVRTGMKNVSLLIVQKVCYKITQRKFGNLRIWKFENILPQALCFKV
jgi:hypothetical protein